MEGPKDGKPALPLEHERLFVAYPSDDLSVEQAAEKISGTHSPRVSSPAYGIGSFSRRELVKLAKTEGESFESAVSIGLQSVLVSPHFLFRIESEPTVQEAEQKTLAGPVNAPTAERDALASHCPTFCG